MENKVKVWIARDECGYAFIHLDKPSKTDKDNIVDIGEWISNRGGGILQEFPQIKWEDNEPTEAYIILANELQSKKEIDWEQRRYEIAKNIYTQYSNTDEKGAIHSADALIKELKKQSE